MKRCALLIEASEVPDEDVLLGAKADVKAYWEWLYSKPGGDWYGSEIKVLNTPTIGEVKKAIQLAGKIDYAFITFSGHGYHSSDLDLTKVCLRDGRMTVRELIPDAARCTLVIDACRNVMSEIFEKSFQLSLAEARRYARFAEERNFRQEFEDLVAKAEKGPVFLYSCDLNESAGESRRGGYFSRLLVEAGNAFGENNTDSSKWFSVRGAFRQAAEATTRKNNQQHPQFEPGRRLVHFPFGV
jgi:hypothetical protein